MQRLIVIPARYGSTRLPGKLLLRESGKPLILHCLEQVARSQKAQKIVVATDDKRIETVVLEAGFEVQMTREDHPSGTDRVCEVAAQLDIPWVVNVQADEPFIDPAHIDALFVALEGGLAPMVTGAVAKARPPQADKSSAYVVLNNKNQALYFSRALIPHNRDGDPAQVYKHVGIYGYSLAFLKKFVAWGPSPLEGIEKLEQLRALEQGYPIGVLIFDKDALSVDTPEDYQAFLKQVSG